MNANDVAKMQAPKTLAAIVFTDVVGFSRHTNIDETRALACFQRDLAIIREVCDRHHGVILKTLGDGAMMRFNSADNALSCAIEIQRIIHEQAQRLDHRDVLSHRIGVHLGDIMVTASDVFGDGVNVAARLQAEAKPGAIVMSRTVYDVVKGKVKFNANYLGPRQLKGIRDAVTLWEIPSIAHQLIEKRNSALDGMLPDEAAEPSTSGFRGVPALFLVIGSLVLIGVATTLIVFAMQGAKAQGARAWASRLAHARALAESRKLQTPAPTAGAVQPAIDVDPYADAELIASLAPLFAKNDFEGMAALVASRAGTGPQATAAAKRYTSLSGYMDWLENRLSLATEQNPIVLEHDPDTGSSSQFFQDSSNHFVRRTETAPSFVELDQLSKQTLIALGEAALLQPHANDEISKEDITQDIQVLQDEAARFGNKPTS